jgi:peptidoglycan/LPS O-acetylase OafA/YrhL
LLADQSGSSAHERSVVNAGSARSGSPYAPDLPYAGGLDGVRALAVAGVVLYHARVGGFSGGFLGVDVFFVLSGYLITSLLLTRRHATGRIDLRQFWLGRVRRLLPAALLVIGVCLVVETVWLRGNLAAFRADAVASTLYFNNWHQIFAGQSYFAAFGRPSLLEHFWSLSVEEQFYLVWPLILAGGLALTSRARVATLAGVLRN